MPSTGLSAWLVRLRASGLVAYGSRAGSDDLVSMPTRRQRPDELALLMESEIDERRFLLFPVALMVVMLLSAALIGLSTGVQGWRVFWPYLSAWSSITLIAVLVWFFAEVAKLARRRADRPLPTVVASFMARDKEGLWLSALVFPLFIGAYTWAKSAIPLVVGYGWEGAWADADRWLFGADAWRITHALIPSTMASAWSFFYAVVWGLALAVVGALVAAFGSSRFATKFFTAMMLSWFIGGFLMAYAISAAGPVFAHLADPAFAERFAPLRAGLVDLLGADDIVMTSQRYLEAGFAAKQAVKGGGISAMPSMHIATATIFILASRRTIWFTPAVLFWALTFFGSVYLGYHYAVDAPVAAVVAMLCWSIARRLYATPSQSTMDDSSEPLVSF